MAGVGRVYPDRAWAETAPEEQGVDSAALAEAVEYLRQGCLANGVDELAIVRNGRLIWRGRDVDRRHTTWSCSKSFASTCLGLLIADGRCSLETPAAEFAPCLREFYPTVTLRHLATMTSGYDAVGGGYGDDPNDGSPTPFDPAPPLAAPGEAYRYWDNAMRTFGLVLTRIAGESLADLFRRRVAEPIGMTDWEWRVQAEVDGLAVNDVAAGFATTAREIARFGLLFLRGGEWHGRRLVPAEWIAAATTNQVPRDLIHEPISPRQARLDGRGIYGYNWWVNGVRASGVREWPSAPTGVYAAVGLNNNRLFVIPEWDVVVARLGTDGNIPSAVWDGFFARLGKALGG